MGVRRAGREVVTVEVFLENYERLKQKAVQKRLNVKEYINDLLGNVLEKEDFIHLVAPYLSIDSYEGNRITIKDVKEKVLVDVFYKDGDLQCETHKSNNCIHTRFIWMTPEISKIKSNGKKIQT